ncbi:hypothetical protein IGI04_015984 [Brassica rapa subsp. trilocularis]|uniref:Uncharacterized protein n=1 Tax=Brassica rapa subsp. trilocularis TaxID=1813537 RepID=A0ABQ7MRU0_BRACM|nr:hypothetical protein IGI04_015984 [Brassica rapa subsp. trilocularis]
MDPASRYKKFKMKRIFIAYKIRSTSMDYREHIASFDMSTLWYGLQRDFKITYIHWGQNGTPYHLVTTLKSVNMNICFVGYSIPI